VSLVFYAASQNIQVPTDISFEDGFKSLHPADILVRCEPNPRFLWSSFKHIGDSQFFEVVTTSKESE
jgi:hypothetical protein